MAVDVTAARRRAGAVWAGFTSGQKTMLGLAVAAVVLGGWFFTKWAAEPTWAPLYGNLGSTDAASVTSADVHLVIPADDVFADDSRKPSASVLLRPKTPGKKFSSDQVRSVVNLVAGSVEGLTPDAVTVADSAGHTLSAPGAEGLGDAGDAQATQTQSFEDGLARSLEDMLAPVTGAGGSVVRVKADLDFDQRSTTTES